MTSTARTQDHFDQRCLIVGGAEYVGASLSELLISQNMGVQSLDDFSVGRRVNIEHLAKSSLFKISETDYAKRLSKAALRNPYIFYLPHLETLSSKCQPMYWLETLPGLLKQLIEACILNKSRLLVAIPYSLMDQQINNPRFAFEGQDSFDKAKSEGNEYIESLLLAYHKSHGLDYRIVRLLDVYGPRMDLTADNPIADLIGQALMDHQITIGDDAIRPVYPTYITDVVYGVYRAMFSEKTDGGQFNIINPHALGLVSVAAYVRQMADIKRNLQFNPNRRAEWMVPEISIDEAEDSLHWSPQVAPKVGLRKTIEYFLRLQKAPKLARARLAAGGLEIGGLGAFGKSPLKDPRLQTSNRQFRGDEAKPKKTLAPLPMHAFEPKSAASYINGFYERIKHRYVVIGALFLLTVLSFFVFHPLAAFGYFGWHGGREIVTAKSLLYEARFNDSILHLKIAEGDFSKAQERFAKLYWVFEIFGQKRDGQSLNQVLLAAQNTTAGVLQLVESLMPIVEMGQNALKTEEASPADFRLIEEKASSGLASSWAQLQLAMAHLESVENSGQGGIIGKKASWLRGEIDYVIQAISFGKQALLYAPEVLGKQGEKRYLIVFQNNTELRPTGGFIGSYAEIVFEQGRMKTFKIDDVYNPDGLIEGKFEPAPALNKYLKVTSGGMRDANWAPQFAESAEQIETYYEAATGTKVDGVVAIDLMVVQGILDIVGPIEVTGVEGNVRAENLFLALEGATELGFSPGSTAKRDAITAVFEVILSRLHEHSAAYLQDLGGLLKKLVLERHIQIYSDHPFLQEALERANLSGQVFQTSGDYLYVVQANVGGNKSNADVETTMGYELTLQDDGSFIGKLLLHFKHNAVLETWPTGKYISYIRLYVPKGVKLLESHGFVDGPFMGEAYGYVQIDGLIELPVDSEMDVSIQYSLPEQFNLNSKNSSYNLYWQKQAGTDQDATSVRILLPSSIVAAGYPDLARAEQNRIVLEDSLLQDRRYHFEFSL